MAPMFAQRSASREKQKKKRRNAQKAATTANHRTLGTDPIFSPLSTLPAEES
jgi:hypothetical protein